MATLAGVREHPWRHQLAAEVHARPYMYLRPGERGSHLALLTGETGIEAEREHVAALCRRFGASPPAPGSNFHLADLGAFRLRWERHTEFASYGVIASAGSRGDAGRFENPPIDLLPKDWRAGLTGELLVAVHWELEPAGGSDPGPDELVRIMGVDNFACSTISGGTARAWMNFAVGADGFGRILVRDVDLRPRQAGRLIQRLVEIETYRMMALLAFPIAREMSGQLYMLGERLATITQGMTASQGLEADRELLGRFVKLSAELEQIAARSLYRLGAARAYAALVDRRIEELREERIEGLQTIREFVDRRLAPAMRTCLSASERLDSLSRRVAQASQMLRTRVDVQLEEQNRDLLASMNRRAKMQIRLQQTVEGLSVAAITYYGVGLIGYGLKALREVGLPLSPEIGMGIAVPIVAAAAWFGLHRMRRWVERQMAVKTPPGE